MLTEVPTIITYAIKVNGVITQNNLPSKTCAEALICNLPADQRALAEVVLITSDGKSVLFG